MKTRPSVALLALALLALTSRARAELPETEAEQLFQQGLEAFDQGRSNEAIERWERLLTEGNPAKVWRVLYNLALAYQAAGDRPRALTRFEDFARRVGEQPGSLPIEFEGRRQDAVERARLIRPEVSLLRVNPSPTGERVAVRIDGGPARDAGFTVYLEPGRYVLQMGEGPRTKTAELVLVKGELFTKVAEQLPPPPTPPPPPYQSPIPLAVIVAGGALSVASVAIPVGLFFRADGLGEEARKLGVTDPAYPTAHAAYEDGRTAYLASWAAPATLAAITLSLLIVDVVDASGDGATPVARLRIDPGGGRLDIALW